MWPKNIALTPQTDASRFEQWSSNALPRHSGYEYPKMLNRICTQKDRDDWLKANRQLDVSTGREHWIGRAPQVGSLIAEVATAEIVEAGLRNQVGQELEARDAQEEQELLSFLYPGRTQAEPVPAIVSIPIAPSMIETKSARSKPRKSSTAVSP